MAHQTTVWVQRLVIPVTIIVAFTLHRFGFGDLQVLAIIVPAFCALMIFTILFDPGPRAKNFVQRLKEIFVDNR